MEMEIWVYTQTEKVGIIIERIYLYTTKPLKALKNLKEFLMIAVLKTNQ